MAASEDSQLSPPRRVPVTGSRRSIPPFQGIVIVADLYELSDSVEALHLRRDLEKTEPATLKRLIEAVDSLGIPFSHYTGPEQLARNADKHRHDIVLSIYGGRTSRSRMALVPAVCEVFGLSFVGPDAYGRMLCQDKAQAKNLAQRCGFYTPRFELLESTADLHRLNEIEVPYVLKPLMEGSSIGMSQANLIQDRCDGSGIAEALLRHFKQPIMAEAFEPGKEVSFNVIRENSGFHISLSEITMQGLDQFFDHSIFDAYEKVLRVHPRNVTNIDHLMTEKDRSLVMRLIDSIGKVDYCRIDGKWRNGRFAFLELTPDAWIAPEGAFAASFIAKGWSYEDVIFRILKASSECQVPGLHGEIPRPRGPRLAHLRSKVSAEFFSPSGSTHLRTGSPASKVS
jgi:D-alanine-D-alanine ligase